MTTQSQTVAPVSVRLEPVSRFLFRRAAIVPALAGLSLVVTVPAIADTATTSVSKTDSGSLGPIVSFVKPEFADVLQGDAKIKVNIQPRRYPAQSVQLFVDGRPASGIVAVMTDFTFHTDVFDDGQHTISVRVQDTQGFIGQSTVTVYINNAKSKPAPTINDSTLAALDWLGIGDGAELKGEVKVKLQTRSDFLAKYVLLRLNDKQTPDAKPPLASWITNRPPYEFSIDTSKYPDGLYVLDSSAWDALDNEENAKRITVMINNSPNATVIGSATVHPTPTPTPAPTPASTPTPTATPTPTPRYGFNGLNNPGSSLGTIAGRKLESYLGALTRPAPASLDPEELSYSDTQTTFPPLDIRVLTNAIQAPKVVHPVVQTPEDVNKVNIKDPGSVITTVDRTSPTPNETPAPPATNGQEPSTSSVPNRTAIGEVTPPATSAGSTVEPGEHTTRMAAATVPGDETRSVPTGHKVPLIPAVVTQADSHTVDLNLPPYQGQGTQIESEASTSPLELVTKPEVIARRRISEVVPTIEKHSVPPAMSVASAADAGSVISAPAPLSGLSGQRFAADIEERSTAPGATTVWQPARKETPVAPPAPVGDAQVTTVRISPATAVTSPSASYELERTERTTERTTTPPSRRTEEGVAVHPHDLAPAHTDHTAGSQNSVKPPAFVQPKEPAVVSPVSSDTDSGRVALPESPSLTAQREDVTPLETQPRMARVDLPVIPCVVPPVASEAATILGPGTQSRGPGASMGAVRDNAIHAARPTLPRFAVNPDYRQATRPRSRAESAIVVSPVEQIDTVSFTAKRNESLAAIADRFKMPLAVVAAANGLPANSNVLKGQTIMVPQSLTVTYKGQAVTSDVAPMLIGSTSVTPFRYLFEKQGGTIAWDDAKQTVTAKNDKYEISITVGSNKAIVNSKEEAMDMAAFLLSGRTMVPTRFFEKALHCTVEWEPTTGRIYVASTPE